MKITNSEFKKWQKKFYNSRAWVKIRDYCKAKNFGICERCNKTGNKMCVHHKTYISKENFNDTEITLNISNLELLCLFCHNKEHGIGAEKLEQRAMFDEDGNVIGLSDTV